MSRFYLVNGNDEKWDLNTIDSFFHSPSGLGFEDNTKFQQIGTNYIPLDKKTKQGVISGKIYFFSPSALQIYRDFVAFARSESLKLMYVPDDPFFVDVRIDSLEKKEVDGENVWITAEVKFNCLSSWYKNEKAREYWDATGGKIYHYGYPYTYRDGAEGNATASITSDSAEDCPCKVTIYGYCENPRWRHYCDGVLIATGRYNGNIEMNRKLVIDTTAVPYSIKEYTLSGGFTGDRYEKADFNTDRFIFLKRGVNRVVVTDDINSLIKVETEGHLIYETV